MSDTTAMVESILGLARQEAEGILGEAREKARQRLESARRELESRSAAISGDGERRAALEERRVSTAAELKFRRELLQAKMALLDEVFAAGYEELKNLPEGEWRRLIRRLLLAAAVRGDEEVAVPAGHRERFAGLLSEVNEELKSQGRRGELRLAGEAPIEAGFILKSADYTVDCSFKALLAERRPILEPEVAALLFGGREGTRPVPDYGFAVGRIRSLETRLLDRGRLERMAEAADLAEALALLGETEYAGSIAGGRRPGEIAAAEFARTRDLVLGLAPKAPELDFLLWRWDLFNLKALLRQDGGDQALNDLGRYTAQDMRAWLAGDSFRLPEFFTAARQAGEAAYQGRDAQMLDAAIDRVYYGRGAALWRSRDTFMAAYWPARIDLINLRTLLRGKHQGFDRGRLAAMLIPGGAILPDRFASRLGETWEEIAAWWGQGPYGTVVQACGSLADLASLERASEISCWKGPSRPRWSRWGSIRCSAIIWPRNTRRAWSTWC